METVPVDEQMYRVVFERDHGQAYDVGTRVTVHAMNKLLRTVALSPAVGNYRVTRCERIRDAGWKALRVSLQLIAGPAAETDLIARPLSAVSLTAGAGADIEGIAGPVAKIDLFTQPCPVSMSPAMVTDARRE
jgi:hypothetical protein